MSHYRNGTVCMRLQCPWVMKKKYGSFYDYHTLHNGASDEQYNANHIGLRFSSMDKEQIDYISAQTVQV